MMVSGLQSYKNIKMKYIFQMGAEKEKIRVCISRCV